MGTWGIGTFENDEAMDFIGDLGEKESDWETLSRLCKDAVRKDPLSASDACQALVAAELLAAGNGKPASDLPEEAVVWLKGRRKPQPAILKSAQAAIARILKPKSELLEVWEATSDIGSWRSSLEALERRLW